MAIDKVPGGAAYSPDRFNLLTPFLLTDETSPMHQVRTQVVQINPKDGAGDVFTMKGGKLYLAASARRKLAAVAGIMENWRESGLIEDTPTKVCYRAIGAIQDAVGQWRPVTATKTIELEQLRKIKETAKEVEAIWAYRYERAETGAWSRLATAALGLKSSYTAEELAKPFAVSRVILAIDYADPEVRRMITARALDAQANVFGQPTTPQGYLTAGGTPGTVGEAIDLDKVSAPDTRLPEDEFPEAPGIVTTATAAGSYDPSAADLPFDAAKPEELPRAKRGKDQTGEWLGCQAPGCTKRLRVAVGQSTDDTEDRLRAANGGVFCQAHRPAHDPGRML
jgi:hypothetical protein